jgi:hypothetical protein
MWVMGLVMCMGSQMEFSVAKTNSVMLPQGHSGHELAGECAKPGVRRGGAPELPHSAPSSRHAAGEGICFRGGEVV